MVIPARRRPHPDRRNGGKDRSRRGAEHAEGVPSLSPRPPHLREKIRFAENAMALANSLSLPCSARVHSLLENRRGKPGATATIHRGKSHAGDLRATQPTPWTSHPNQPSRRRAKTPPPPRMAPSAAPKRRPPIRGSPASCHRSVRSPRTSTPRSMKPWPRWGLGGGWAGEGTGTQGRYPRRGQGQEAPPRPARRAAQRHPHRRRRQAQTPRPPRCPGGSRAPHRGGRLGRPNRYFRRVRPQGTRRRFAGAVAG